MSPNNSAVRPSRAEPQTIPLPQGADNPSCPTCGGRMWDNRASKRNPRAPDFKCRDRSCEGVLWPGQHRATLLVSTPPAVAAAQSAEGRDEGTTMQPQDVTSSSRAKYLDVTDFVLSSVCSKYQEQGLACAPETVAAIAATLYIAESRREGR